MKKLDLSYLCITIGSLCGFTKETNWYSRSIIPA